MKSNQAKNAQAIEPNDVRMRGGAFHRHLVDHVCADLRDAGFETRLEHPCRLPDGLLDFVDILALRDAFQLACEIETTPRYASVNISKAQSLELPLFVVTPNRNVRRAILNKCESQLQNAEKGRIWILLPDEVGQALRTCFPEFSSGKWGNGNTENWKNSSR